MKQTIEATETINNSTMEENTMNNNTMNNNTMNNNTPVEDIVKNATDNAEKKAGRLEKGANYLINNVRYVRNAIAKHAKDIEGMSQEEVEVYLRTKAESIFNDILNAATKFSGEIKEDIKFCPELARDVERTDDVISVMHDILDSEDKKGWGKVKAIVVELIKFIVRIFIKVGQIILKIAVTILVGAVKIGAIAINTAFKTVGVVNKEVIQPTVDTAKSAVAKHKAKKEDDIEFMDDFDSYAEELEFMDNFDDYAKDLATE